MQFGSNALYDMHQDSVPGRSVGPSGGRGFGTSFTNDAGNAGYEGIFSDMTDDDRRQLMGMFSNWYQQNQNMPQPGDGAP